MIDFHNHVLPNVDDGPKTIEESRDMLRYASVQGITEIVQTVHFQHPKMEGKNVEYSYLKGELKKTQDYINKNNLNIKMHLSAEVFYLPNLLDISDNPLLTIGNGKYMLIEFSTNIFPQNYEEEFYKLQVKGITPIIAHPERYRFVQNDIKILQMWLDRGFVVQVDAGSLIGHFGKNTKKIAIQMLNSGLFHIIGSDAHNNRARNFCIKEAYRVIKKINSNKNIKILKQNTESLLLGKKVERLNKSNKKNISYLVSRMFKL